MQHLFHLEVFIFFQTAPLISGSDGKTDHTVCQTPKFGLTCFPYIAGNSSDITYSNLCTNSVDIKENLTPSSRS